MDEPLGYLEIARTESSIYARVVGLGVASVGIDLWDFSEEMVRKGFDRFLIDLGPCRSMDSTFMGVLVGIAESPCVSTDSGVVVLNPSDHHLKLMEGLGLPKMITIRRGGTEQPDMVMERLDSFPRTPEERMRKIRDVHQKLVELDRRNEEKFRAFLDLLDKELSA